MANNENVQSSENLDEQQGIDNDVINKCMLGDIKTGTKCIIVLAMLFVYGLISLGVLVTDHYREKEYNTYDMGVGNVAPSALIEKKVRYKQYFYTPRRTNGLDILFATYNTIPEKNLYISIYDAETDEKVGTQKISHKDIIDNEYARIIFDDFRLEEGKHFYFEVYSKSQKPESVSFWLTTSTSPYTDLLLYGDEEQPDMCVSFKLCYEYNGKGLITWIFISVIFALILNAVIVKLFGDEKIRYQVGAALVQMSMIVLLLWGYAHYVMK